MKLSTLILFVGLLTSVSKCAVAQNPKDLVKASLMADVKTIKPGDTFHVGLMLAIKPKWHVYWENPGDSGSPTRLKITAPQGVSVGPVQFPLPKTFRQPGDVAGYGYEDEVMLIARVTVPADWPAGKAIELKADADWLCCEEVCLPGKASTTLRVAVGETTTPDNERDFKTWREKLPAGVEDAPFRMKASGQTVTLSWNKAAKGVQALPVAPDGVEVASMELKHEGAVTTITPKLRLLGGEKKAGAALGWLILYEDESGTRRGVRLSIPLN